MIWQAWTEDYGHSDEQSIARSSLEGVEKSNALTTETTTPSLAIEQSATTEEEEDHSMEFHRPRLSPKRVLATGHI